MTSRFRTSGSLDAITHVQPWYSSDKVACLGSLVKTNRGNLSYVDYVGIRRSMSDEVVSNYRKRSAAGEVIMNRMSSLLSELTPSLIGGPLVFKGNGIQCSGAASYQTIYEFPSTYPMSHVTGFEPSNGYWKGPHLLSNGEMENAIDEASTRCHNNRGRPETNLWETLAERKQTYAMLGSTLESIKTITRTMSDQVANSNSSVTRYLVKNYSKATIGLAGLWLINRYGLTPLLKDVAALRKQLSETLDSAERHTSRGKADVSRVATENGSWVLSGNHIAANWNAVNSDVFLVRAMSLDEWKLSLADHFGLSWKGLASLPYELLTLSFVADWFVNMGDFIGGLVPLPGVNQRGACIAYQRVSSRTFNVTGYSPVGIAAVLSSGTLSKIGVSTEKVRVPGLRAPSLVRLNRSKVDPALAKNQDRVVDACALIGQRLARVTFHLGQHLIIK